MKTSWGYIVFSDLCEHYNNYCTCNDLIFVNQINLADVVKLGNFENDAFSENMQIMSNERIRIQGTQYQHKYL